MSTELENVRRAVAEFDKVAAGIAALRHKYEGVVYNVTTADGMASAKRARRAIREPRIEIEKIRKEAKAPILALGRHLDGEAKRITEELVAIENPIDGMIRAEEARKEAERQAKIHAEQERVAGHQGEIARMRLIAETVTSACLPESIIAAVRRLEGGLVRDFQEFQEEAERVREEALVALRGAHIEAVERIEREAQERAEAERRRAEGEARLAAEREQLAREREEHERQQAAAREAHEREQRALRERQEEIERQAREQATRQAAIERQEREQREAQALMEAKAEAKERHEREVQEALVRVNAMTARDFLTVLGSYTGYDHGALARRLAQIPRKDWITLADELKDKTA